MDLFSRTKPELVNPKSLKQINKLYNLTSGERIPTFGENLLYFYDNYIFPNLFPLVVLLVVALFLTIRYMLKKHRQENFKKHSKPKKKKVSDTDDKDYRIKFDDTDLDDLINIDDLDNFQ